MDLIRSRAEYFPFELMFLVFVVAVIRLFLAGGCQLADV
jgi:hypothetical protein